MRGGMLVYLPRQDISLAVPINDYPEEEGRIKSK